MMKKNLQALRKLLWCVPLLLLLAGCTAAASSASSATVSSHAGSVAASLAEADSTAISAVEKNTSETPVLVAYFSCTGNTESVAEKIAAQTQAACYRITPADPYTADDLNYNDDSCRANQEMNDASARPSLADEPADLTTCDTIYLGYPIWWGTAPRIIQTFLESNDCSGKTIYLFCTSGSSGVERSLRELQEQYPSVNFAAGKRFSANASNEDIAAWLESLSS